MWRGGWGRNGYRYFVVDKGEVCWYPKNELPIERYFLSSLKPYSHNEDTNRPQSGNPWGTITPSTLRLTGVDVNYTIPIGRYFLSWLKLFSQWGYIRPPIRVCQLYYPDWELLLSWLKLFSQWGYIRPQSGYVNYTIPIGRYFYPDWNYSPNEDTLGPNQGMSTILSRVGDTFILIEILILKKRGSKVKFSFVMHSFSNR